MARFIMILVLGAVIAYGLTNITLNEHTSQGTQNSMDNYSYSQARDIANSMVDIILMRMANDGKYRVETSRSEDLFGGYVTYQTQDMFFEGEDLVQISVSAKYNGVSKSVTAFSRVFDFNNMPPPIPLKAAITTNGPTETNGDMIVDGRDHDISGGLIPVNGTLGIWSASSFAQSGSSEIGGTVSSVDYVPSKPANPLTVEQNQTWPDGIPDTPDKVMGGITEGYPEGTLKNAAIQGFGGGQYVDDPADLKYPLKGITYVELPSGSEWKEARVEGEGILIVHNSATNAILKNTDENYEYKGLVIVDDLVHVHSKITGSVFVLTKSPSSGNVLGNGKGKVLYSNESLANAIADIEMKVKTRYGFGKKRLAVKYWYE